MWNTGFLVLTWCFVGFFERSADAVPSMPSFAVVAADADKEAACKEGTFGAAQSPSFGLLVTNCSFLLTTLSFAAARGL